MLGAKAGGASVQTGYGYEMEAIAACTIGGVSVTGGRGKVSSAIIGVAVFELLKVALQYLGMNANAQYIAIGVVIFTSLTYCLTFLHIDTNLQFVFKGLIIIAAVALDSIKYLKRK